MFFLKYLILNSKLDILDNFPNDGSIFPTTSTKNQSKSLRQKKVSLCRRSEFRRPCTKKSQFECAHSKTSEFRLLPFQAHNQEFPESGATESRNSYITSGIKANPEFLTIFRTFRGSKIRIRNVGKAGILLGFRGGSATLCLCMDVSHLARSCERVVRAWWRCGTGARGRV